MVQSFECGLLWPDVAAIISVLRNTVMKLTVPCPSALHRSKREQYHDADILRLSLEQEELLARVRDYVRFAVIVCAHCHPSRKEGSAFRYSA